ncbi:hypothetical protein R1flu_012314 [Riccia fluitans]|uniref:Uncharacterized protein n=1 Tax=Riccia fluitans TaxID=41844 RepID=A0ABD1ZA95_9MARC
MAAVSFAVMLPQSSTQGPPLGVSNLVHIRLPTGDRTCPSTVHAGDSVRHRLAKSDFFGHLLTTSFSIGCLSRVEVVATRAAQGAHSGLVAGGYGVGHPAYSYTQYLQKSASQPSIKSNRQRNGPQKEPEDIVPKKALYGGAVIKVIGVGGGGCNAVNEMVRTKLPNVEFWGVNTDTQALSRCLAPNKLQIGNGVTRGRGAGGSTEVGFEAATESLGELSLALEGSDLVFIAVGMGGGTGSGAGPVVARLAKAMGALTIGIVTEPFGFEGLRRAKQAREGLIAMKQAADTVVVVPNDRLLDSVTEETSVWDAFHLADDVLRQGVQGISDIITVPGLVNVDFADVRAIMSNAGSAMLGIGVGYGKNRAVDVTRSAIMSPLLHCVTKPTGIVYNVTGGTDLTLHEVNIAAEMVYSMADPDANVIFGAPAVERRSTNDGGREFVLDPDEATTISRRARLFAETASEEARRRKIGQVMNLDSLTASG